MDEFPGILLYFYMPDWKFFCLFFIDSFFLYKLLYIIILILILSIK